MPSRSRWSAGVASAHARMRDVVAVDDQHDVGGREHRLDARRASRRPRRAGRCGAVRRVGAGSRAARRSRRSASAGAPSRSRRCSASSVTESWRAAAPASASARVVARAEPRLRALGPGAQLAGVGAHAPQVVLERARPLRRARRVVLLLLHFGVRLVELRLQRVDLPLRGARGRDRVVFARPARRALLLQLLLGTRGRGFGLDPGRVGSPARFFERGAFLRQRLALVGRALPRHAAARRARPRSRARTRSLRADAAHSADA